MPHIARAFPMDAQRVFQLTKLITMAAIWAMDIGQALAQMPDSLRSELKVNLEMRPRAEFKDGCRLWKDDDTGADFYMTQRTRMNIMYSRRSWNAVAALQEIHVWTKSGSRPDIGSMNAFELYVEPVLAKGLRLRIGRQALSLDNGRMFSAAPWSQQGRSHEGVRLLYDSGRLSTDLSVFTTRPYGTRFDAAYSPVAGHSYKLLAVHYLIYRFPKHFTVTFINYTDIHPRDSSPDTDTQTMTTGGRVEYAHANMYATLSAFYQFGSTTSRQRLSAYYLQPEVRGTFGTTTVRLGAEVLSGASATLDGDVSQSFIVNYGVAWKFMGNMNLFTRFPKDVAGRGLVSPYLFVIQKVGRRLSLRADSNLLFTQYPLMAPDKTEAERYLGFENDLSLNYRPKEVFDINLGFSYLIASDSMKLLGKVKGGGTVPIWTYLMVSFSPVILHVRNYRTR
ncbi:MAG: alginate export family protein [Flavobacteriales bacterium]|nr:alginate export family protein [Flavobacteriales bacterium]